jgi:hypothetical protein
MKWLLPTKLDRYCPVEELPGSTVARPARGFEETPRGVQVSLWNGLFIWIIYNSEIDIRAEQLASFLFCEE